MGVGVTVRARHRQDQEHRAGPAAAKAPDRRPDRPMVVLGVLAILALGVVVRFVCRSDLWADEALSVAIARLPVDRILSALRHDGAPPLYYLLLHGWMRVFGTG